MEDRLQQGANKWRSELFNHRPDLEEEEPMEKVGPPEKWEKVASGLWMQKAEWNGTVIRAESEQPHSPR